MSTILMAWELGGGMGHLRKLLRIATPLAEVGHRVVFVVKDPIAAHAVLRESNFPILPVPIFPGSLAVKRFQARTFADILANRGFSDFHRLVAMVDCWQALMNLVQPDLIVCDYAPTACVAAYGTTPIVMIGTGFTVPPIHCGTFPTLDANATPLVPQSQVLDVVQQVQRHRGRPVPETLPQLFMTDGRFVCCFPELDPHGEDRASECVGPVEDLVDFSPPPEQTSFFAYLAGDSCEPILAALVDPARPGSAYIRDTSPGVIDRLRQRGLSIYENPPPLCEVLPKVSVILHHAGCVTSHEALCAGRPQVLWPKHLEQGLTAQSLGKLGVAAYVPGPIVPAGMGMLVDNVISDSGFADKAAEWAKRVHDRGPYRAVEKITERCLQLLE